MQIQALGHVVVRVTDIARAEQFYAGVLGLPICARYDENGTRMTFFTLGDHHDFAVMEVPGDAATTEGAGLHHVAFKIGDSLDQLRDARDRLTAAGVATDPIDHEVTKSLYMADPDGNGVELYIDASAIWKTEPQRVAQLAPLEL
jgi:catechol 2,3-dioxygenase